MGENPSHVNFVYYRDKGTCKKSMEKSKRIGDTAEK